MKVFWFDTETSGLDEYKHGIISLAYIIEIDGEVVESGQIFSNCEGKDINEFALQVNGFTREQIAAFPPQKEMYLELNRVFGRYVDKYNKEDKLVAGGYNIAFDMKFLRKLWEANGDKYLGSFIAFGVIDPSQITRFLEYCGRRDFKAAGKLVDIAKSYGMNTTNAHDAMADVRMTMAVTKRIQDDLS